MNAYRIKIRTPLKRRFKEKDKFAAPLVLILFLCFTCALCFLFGTLIYCVGVLRFTLCIWRDICAALQTRSTRPPQLYLFPYRFILLGNLCWLIMANTVEIISATRRDYILHCMRVYLVWRSSYIYKPRKIWFSHDKLYFLAYYYFVYALLYL